MPVIVVKVSGSLFDHPHLGPGLNHYLDPLLRAGPVWLIPGGGRFTDAVRDYDRIHHLGDEATHWLALRSLSVSALFLSAFLKRDGLTILDCYDFALADDGCPCSLPYSWSVTSDSIAARAAVVGGASRLVLLKSVDVPPDTPWDEAAAHGWVDPHFPAVAHGLTAEVVNFRRWLDEYGSPLPPGLDSFHDPHQK
ncbi:MAG TPA: hypothetical protein VFG68_23605 [Fimbriiglobus sp.]|nr:hypothetical protein [Fimbriiglobus sp.]